MTHLYDGGLNMIDFFHIFVHGEQKTWYYTTKLCNSITMEVAVV